jgi:hypothetical protein
MEKISLSSFLGEFKGDFLLFVPFDTNSIPIDFVPV